MTKHLTGFDEEVKLGQLGEILENDSVVMSVEFSDERNRSIPPPGEPLWRGVTLSSYENGRWRRQLQRSRQSIEALKDFRNSLENPRKVIRQVIKLEANDSPTLFAMRPILGLWAGAANQLAPSLSPVDGSITRRPEARGAYDYEVLSDTNVQAPQDGELPPSADGVKALETLDGKLKARLAEIALPLVKDLPGEGIAGVTRRAQALERYLRDSGKFGYTLEMRVDRFPDRSGRGFPDQPQGRTLRVFLQRPLLAPAIHRHSRADRQRLQGGRLERSHPVDERPPEART